MTHDAKLRIQLKSTYIHTYIHTYTTVRFSKYEFYNKLLGDVTLLRVTPGVT